MLKSADAEDVRIHTIFVYEDDPKLGKVAAQLEALHASGSLHATPVVIAVPCAEAYVGAGGKTTSPLDSEDDAAETDFKFRMSSLQNRMVRLAIERSGIDHSFQASVVVFVLLRLRRSTAIPDQPGRITRVIRSCIPSGAFPSWLSRHPGGYKRRPMGPMENLQPDFSKTILLVCVPWFIERIRSEIRTRGGCYLARFQSDPKHTDSFDEMLTCRTTPMLRFTVIYGDSCSPHYPIDINR